MRNANNKPNRFRAALVALLAGDAPAPAPAPVAPAAPAAPAASVLGYLWADPSHGTVFHTDATGAPLATCPTSHDYATWLEMFGTRDDSGTYALAPNGYPMLAYQYPGRVRRVTVSGLGKALALATKPGIRWSPLDRPLAKGSPDELEARAARQHAIDAILMDVATAGAPQAAVRAAIASGAMTPEDAAHEARVHAWMEGQTPVAGEIGEPMGVAIEREAMQRARAARAEIEQDERFDAIAALMSDE